MIASKMRFPTFILPLISFIIFSLLFIIIIGVINNLQITLEEIILLFVILLILTFIIFPIMLSVTYVAAFILCYLAYFIFRLTIPKPISSQGLHEIIEKKPNKFKIRINFISVLIKYFLPTFELVDYLTRILGNLAYKYIQNHMEERADELHNEIVICPSKGNFKSYYTYGPDLLVKYFVKNGIPYRVRECKSAEEFREIVQDNSVGVLWLFGHGRIGRFGVTDKEVILYSEFKDELYRDLPKKIAVYQFHCNPKDDVSPDALSRIIVKGWDFRESGYHSPYTKISSVSFILHHTNKFPGIWNP